MSRPHVYILTWCRRIQQLYGTTLIFKTLRDGFPNCPVHVVDSASLPDARAVVHKAAAECGAQFLQFEQPLTLTAFFQQALMLQKQGPAVFLDPDICLWERIEDWQFKALVAGRCIPRHDCEFTGCLTEARLHPSFLWIPDVARLLAKIQVTRERRIHFDPFQPAMVHLDGAWRFIDVAGGLYSVCAGDEIESFSERHLNAYDHLFGGTYADKVIARVGERLGSFYRDIHRAAQEDYRQLRGCWRVQEEYFQNRRRP